jgi:hypothetical protein
LREESRLRVFENRVLGRIFGSNRDEARGEWRTLHTEELKDLYYSPNIFWVTKWRRMRWAGHVASMGRGEVYRGFWWGNLIERDHLGDPGLERDNIKMYLQEVGCGGMDWIDLNQERELMNAVMNLRVP